MLPVYEERKPNNTIRYESKDSGVLELKKKHNLLDVFCYFLYKYCFRLLLFIIINVISRFLFKHWYAILSFNNFYLYLLKIRNMPILKRYLAIIVLKNTSKLLCGQTIAGCWQFLPAKCMLNPSEIPGLLGFLNVSPTPWCYWMWSILKLLYPFRSVHYSLLFQIVNQSWPIAKRGINPLFNF